MNPVIQRLGWMLIHSVWQDAIIWCVLQIGLRAMARRAPQVRYVAACLALLAMAILPWLTFDASDLATRLRQHHPEDARATLSAGLSAPVRAVQSESASASPAYPSADDSRTPRSSSTTIAHDWSRLLPALVTLWLLGVTIFSTRFGARCAWVRRLMTQPLPVLPSPWQDRFGALLRTAGIRKAIRLGESAATTVPIIAGWLKPLILLPLGTLANVPVDQVEAIILHELAHVARHDYVINLFQSALETLFFYHPAVWSVSRRIRRERELACDDQAVQWCGQPRKYAEALAGFEQYRAHAPVMAATGEGDLLARIRRILGAAQAERRGASFAGLLGLGAVALYLVSMLMAPALLTAGAQTALRMEKTGPTVAVVTDAKTGKPIAGAEIDLAARQPKYSGEPTTFAPGEKVLGHTDAAGRFQITSFSADNNYSIYASARGYPVDSFMIAPGDSDRLCELDPGIRVRGRILDPNGLLNAKGVKGRVQLAAVFLVDPQVLDDENVHYYDVTQLAKLPDVQHVIPFEFDALPSSDRYSVDIEFENPELRKYGSSAWGAGGEGYDLYNMPKGQNIDDFVIDLGKEPFDVNEAIARRGKRKVQITFKASDGGKVTGSMAGECLTGYPYLVLTATTGGYFDITTGTGSTSLSQFRHLPTVPIRDGKAEVDVSVGSVLTVTSDKLNGYVVRPGGIIQVPPGDGVYSRTVTVDPAGVLHGKAIIPAALEKLKLTVSYVTVKAPPGFGQTTVWGEGSGTWGSPVADGKYVSMPLPFGGTYEPVMYCAPAYYVGEPATLDASHRSAERDVNIGGANGVLSGKFLDEKGMPAAYEEVMLQYHPVADDGSSNDFLSTPTTTGSDGTFEIRGMNFDVPGYYTLRASGKDFIKTGAHIDGHTPQPVVLRASPDPGKKDTAR